MLFKGYIELKGKKAIEKFKDRDDLRTYAQIRHCTSFAGVLADGIAMIDIDNAIVAKRVMKLVEDLQLKCRVYQTTRGMHFYFRNSNIKKCGTHVKLALGIESDIKLGGHNSYDALKVDGVEREIIYDYSDECEVYDVLPYFFLPVRNGMQFAGLDEGDGRNQALFNYILTLQANGFTKEQIREILTFINYYILDTPLSESELSTIMRDDSFKDDIEPVFFGEKNKFLFDVFARFLIDKYHIVKIDNQLHIYRDGIYVHGENKIEHVMIEHISSLPKQKRSEVLSYMNVLLENNYTMADARYIAFNNGIYDVIKDELLPFDSSIIITNKIPHDFNRNADNQIVDKTLDKIACHNEDIFNLLIEVVGFCMYRRNELRKAFILTGDKRGGKSTYLDMIMNMLGEENTTSLDLKELGDRFKTSELYHKLANIGDDIGDEFIANPAIFKKVVSGNRVNAERKGQDPFDFNSYAKQLFSANDVPRIKDKGGAVIDRLVIVPFNATFSKDDPDYDPYIRYKLIEEDSIERLILLGIEGLKRVIANNGFTICTDIQKELKEYDKSNNPILLFIDDNDIESFRNEVTAVVYQQYCEYCICNGFNSLSSIEFSRQMKKQCGFDIVTKSIKGKKYRAFV